MIQALLFPQFEPYNWAYLDLDYHSRDVVGEPNPLIDPAKCQEWIDGLHKEFHVERSYGGYLENRSNVWRGWYQKPGEFFHLGIDYNVPAGTLVHMPVPGVLVHSEIDPDTVCGWGGKVIFRVKDMYLVVGHLKDIVTEMREYATGEIIGRVAPWPENGNTFHHVHVQAMKHFDPTADGYGPWYEGIGDDFPHPAVLTF